jgi:hypothetical protein
LVNFLLGITISNQDRQNRITWTGHLEQGSWNRRCRTEQPEQDDQVRTARTRTDRTRQIELDTQVRTAITGQPCQDGHDRKARKSEPRKGSHG